MDDVAIAPGDLIAAATAEKVSDGVEELVEQLFHFCEIVNDEKWSTLNLHAWSYFVGIGLDWIVIIGFPKDIFESFSNLDI